MGIEAIYPGPNTSVDFIKKLQERSIQISMDGRGRAMDNIFTERLLSLDKVRAENIDDRTKDFSQ